MNRHPVWSTANYTAEHKDLQAVCLATSNNGKCALISRRSISVISTDKLSDVEYNIKRDTKWDTTYAEFSTLQRSYIAITNAQTVQIFDTDDTGPTSLIHTLRGHTRTITDLNWSYNDANELATASYDNYMHIWDLRDGARKPSLSMHSIAGATQVKWAKMDDHYLATSHEGDVRIWDKRKSNTPIHYITAHLSKINGIDWNPSSSGQFVTCSQDGNIKFWDLLTSVYKGKSDSILNTGLPVWKARFTPFENGLMTALVPQLRRTENNLWLWNISNLAQPLHSFAGHLDVVLDFGWNVKSNTECELITWAKDNALRLWQLNSQTFQNTIAQSNNTEESADSNGDQEEQFNSDSESTKLDNIELGRSNNPSPISSKIESTKSENDNDSDLGKSEAVGGGSNTLTSNSIILSLSQEFSLVNQNIPNIIIEELNAAKRICIVATKSVFSCRLKIFFPQNYPYNVIPQFMFLNDKSDHDTSMSTKSLTESMKKELLKVLQTTATSQVQRNRTCLEKCLRQFTSTFERLISANHQNATPAKSHTLLDLLPSHKYGSYLDASVPFPRTSGARFCSSDILVCFGRPPHLEQMNAPTEFTPRSLSALSAYLTTHVRAFNNHFKDDKKDSFALSISNFYIDSSRKRKLRHKTSSSHADKSPKHKTPNLCGPVSVFNAAKLLPISRSLAEQYIVTSKDGITGICEMNAKIAANSSRRDLAQMWTLVRLSAEIYLKSMRSSDSFLTPWSEHPFGRKMIQSMIEHYALNNNDIQTAAMIACAFSQLNVNSESFLIKPFYALDQDTNMFRFPVVNELPKSDSVVDHRNFLSAKENIRTRSNSWSEHGETVFKQELFLNYRRNSKQKNDKIERDSILDPDYMLQYDYYKKIYADVLYRWKLIEKRALLLQTIQSQLLSEDESLYHLPFATLCPSERCTADKRLCHDVFCSVCKKHSFVCSMCRIPVKGAANFCIDCGHGGHTEHMEEWFQTQLECPTGCGCQCIPSSQAE